MEERRRRNQMLNILSEKKKRHFYESQLGTVRKVLLEKGKKKGHLTGFTDNYVKVDVALEPTWVNHVITMELSTINTEGLVIASLDPALV
jgi:threonylcarbamoyladenosine tRNA methylthiotransferase MtaB